MYTLELQQKNLKELKEIGFELNVQPEGDRRCRQNWIDALVGAELPLLQLLEVSPVVEVEPIVNSSSTINGTAIEIQHQEPIETPPGVEFNAEEFRETHAAEIDTYFESFAQCDQPPGRGDGKGRLDVGPELTQSAIGFCAPPVTFSSRFLATYPPYFGEVHYRAEETGQLNLLEPETSDEPPDPDDFQTLAEFQKAIAIWDAQHPEPLEVSLDSMCEWAPCPDEWYEPVSSSITFSIPTFDAWRDRQNRQNDSDEPPDTGIYARLPGPKPPKFPPCVIPSPGAIGYSNKSAVPELSRNYPETIPKLFHSIAAGSSTQPARSPPGGDAM